MSKQIVRRIRGILVILVILIVLIAKKINASIARFILRRFITKKVSSSRCLLIVIAKHFIFNRRVV